MVQTMPRPLGSGKAGDCSGSGQPKGLSCRLRRIQPTPLSPERAPALLPNVYLPFLLTNVHAAFTCLGPWPSARSTRGPASMQPGSAVCLSSANERRAEVPFLRVSLKESAFPSHFLECIHESCSSSLILNHEIARQRQQSGMNRGPGSLVAINPQVHLELLLQASYMRAND